MFMQTEFTNNVCQTCITLALEAFTFHDKNVGKESKDFCICQFSPYGNFPRDLLDPLHTWEGLKGISNSHISICPKCHKIWCHFSGGCRHKRVSGDTNFECIFLSSLRIFQKVPLPSWAENAVSILKRRRKGVL